MIIEIALRLFGLQFLRDHLGDKILCRCLPCTARHSNHIPRPLLSSFRRQLLQRYQRILYTDHGSIRVHRTIRNRRYGTLRQCLSDVSIAIVIRPAQREEHITWREGARIHAPSSC